MTSIAIDNGTNLNEFLYLLRRWQDTVSAPWRKLLLARDIWKLLFKLKLVEQISLSAAKEMRALVESCSDLCDKGHCQLQYGCMEKHIETSKEIMTTLYAIRDALEEIPFFAKPLASFDRVLDHWEPLSEDLAVRSTPEIWAAYQREVAQLNDPEDISDLKAFYASEVFDFAEP